jgi:hypothetical protein
MIETIPIHCTSLYGAYGSHSMLQGDRAPAAEAGLMGRCVLCFVVAPSIVPISTVSGRVSLAAVSVQGASTTGYV